MKTNNTVHARDIVISRAQLIPSGLLMRPETKKGGFLISFLIKSSETLLQEILQKSEKMGNKDFELWFFEQESPKALPKEISNSNLHSFINKTCKKEIISSSSPYQGYSANPPTYHIDVIFHTYAEAE